MKRLKIIYWNPKNICDKPDLILYNGKEEFHGTAGGVMYSFNNENWTYIVDKVDVCENSVNCGLFLEILLKDEEKSKITLHEIK